MAEKFRPAAIKALGQMTQSEKSENDKQFLERNNVKSLLNNLLESLYHHQPDDPLNYICNYFENLNHIGDPVKLAYERLKSLNTHSPSLDDCLFEVYQIFMKAATAVQISNGKTYKKIPSSKKAPKVLFGDLFNKLIDLLVRGILTEIKTILCEKLKRRPCDAISFQLFKSSFKLICLCKEYLNECTLLYNDLDTYSAYSQVNEQVSMTILDQLKKSLKINKEENCQSSIQSLYEISPAGVSEAFLEKPVSKHKYAETITLDDFLILAAKPFIESIRL